MGRKRVKAYIPDPAFPRGSSPMGVNFNREERDRSWKIAYFGSSALWVVLVGLAVINGIDFNIVTTAPACYASLEQMRATNTLPLGLPACSDVNVTFSSNSTRSAQMSPSPPPASPPMDFGRRLQEESPQVLDATVNNAIGTVLGAIFTALVLSIAIGIGWMKLLSVYAKEIVYMTVALIPTVLFLGGFAALLFLPQEAALMGYVTLLAGVAATAVLYCMRNKLQLTAAIITEAMRAFRANYSIFCWGLLIVFVLAILAIVTFAGIIFVVLSTRWDIGQRTVNGVTCAACGLVPSSLQYGHAFIMFMWLGWTSQLAMQVRMYTIGGATAIWYFHENDPRAGSSGVRTAVGWALTTGFGTNAYAAVVLYIIESTRKSLEDSADGDNFCCACVARCALSCVGALLDFFNSFLVVMCAITGDDLCQSVKGTFHLLRRNMLSAFVVDAVSDTVLGLGAFVFSLIIAGAGVGVAATMSVPPGLESVRSTAMLLAGIFSFIMGLTVLSYYAGLATNFIASIFVCYAIDKDHGVASQAHASIHHSFAALHIDPATGKPGGAPPPMARPMVHTHAPPSGPPPGSAYSSASPLPPGAGGYRSASPVPHGSPGPGAMYGSAGPGAMYGSAGPGAMYGTGGRPVSPMPAGPLLTAPAPGGFRSMSPIPDRPVSPMMAGAAMPGFRSTSPMPGGAYRSTSPMPGGMPPGGFRSTSPMPGRPVSPMPGRPVSPMPSYASPGVRGYDPRV